MYGSLPRRSILGSPRASRTVIFTPQICGSGGSGSYSMQTRTSPDSLPFFRNCTQSSSAQASLLLCVRRLLSTKLPIKSLADSPSSSSQHEINTDGTPATTGKHSSTSPVPPSHFGSVPPPSTVEVCKVSSPTVTVTKGSLAPTRSIFGRPLASKTVTVIPRRTGSGGFASHSTSTCTVPRFFPFSSTSCSH